MALSPPTPLSDSDKLHVLQHLDQFREWRSLDERRYCLVCGKIITGRQIQVVGDADAHGPVRLSCPTEQCSSIPMDWVLPTDEILAIAGRVAAAPADVPQMGADSDTERGVASRLRKLAVHFKGASHA
ncbi:MAG: hypothetical protein J2P56_01050 [Verrucomicrobia bacterium]|nr:hypothetical protein [Verrucomicrobiota bacterium]